METITFMTTMGIVMSIGVCALLILDIIVNAVKVFEMMRLLKKFDAARAAVLLEEELNGQRRGKVVPWSQRRENGISKIKP